MSKKRKMYRWAARRAMDKFINCGAWFRSSITSDAYIREELARRGIVHKIRWYHGA